MPTRKQKTPVRARGRKSRRPSPKSPPAEPAASAAAKQVYSAVRKIPRGRVVTYGDLAMLIGLPRGHRLVARAMRTCPAGLPWQRVVGRHDQRRARISIGDPQHAALQRKLLAAEGVTFDAGGYIVMRKFGWLPQ